MSASRLLAALGLAAAVAACTNTPSGRSQLLLVSDSQMNQMGATAFAQMKANDKLSVVPEKSVYAQCIVNALVAELPDEWRRLQWEAQAFAIAEPNAFALPGGKVGINTGLLRVATDQDQLAAVLAHEVAHVTYRHAGERVSQQQLAQTGMALANAYAGRNASPNETKLLMAAMGAGVQVGVLLPFSRAHESEADIAGQALMARAGFDPAAAVTLWQNMREASGKQGRPPQILSTHPDPGRRIEALQANVSKLQPVVQQARAAGKRPSCRG
ncbi:M48 family metallopeptidase [Pseudomarimonas salicorniae]|uniref:M48 family metallopeptidase n=1 Tax=Pseudomarimonas salicorniae TaxID=2933270 RepID=A0ABT0GC26_9GAMM|nr:M48 family metallopeptidase [Lysobacter sp. CAU 1642]MCK7592070.1 M48 family metallopeptidase [Lysobacter sp. CAU 1642]